MRRAILILLLLGFTGAIYSQKVKKSEIIRNIAVNPIIPGFNPDPSILRVGDDYYTAVSTFQWFPGVAIYHSKDLSHWNLLTNVLTRRFQLDMMGVPNSGGVYAPQISLKNGTYYLVYTNIKGNKWPYMDGINYVVKAPSITGPWSDPVLLNAFGFDPSLFHDDNGRSYLLQNEVNFRNNIEVKAKIIMQEFDTDKMELVGEKRTICHKYAEGPHIYKVDGKYHLVVATGGTSYGHMTETERSDSVWGPYSSNPANPILTSKDNPSLHVQKAGHASFVQTQFGDWYMVHLGARPLYPEKQCPLGRETCIQELEWKNGWPQLAGGRNFPRDTVEIKKLRPVNQSELKSRNDFDENTLSPDLYTLRLPVDDSWASLTARKGYLRVRGQLGLLNSVEQSLIARRVTSFRFLAESAFEFEPSSYREMAGLICYYDSRNFLYLAVSHDSIRGKCVNILEMDESKESSIREVLPESIPVNPGKCFLRVEMNLHAIQFYYSSNGLDWKPIGPVFNSTSLSDEKNFGFTGMMIGICVQDIAYMTKYADFDYFEYKDLSK